MIIGVGHVEFKWMEKFGNSRLNEGPLVAICYDVSQAYSALFISIIRIFHLLFSIFPSELKCCVLLVRGIF